MVGSVFYILIGQYKAAATFSPNADNKPSETDTQDGLPGI